MAKQKKAASPDEEVARYYTKVHNKLSPINLAVLALINVILFIGIITFFFMLNIFMEKPTVSETERRELAKMPEFSLETLFSGEYTRGVELHFADTFPFREQFVEFSAMMTESMGIRVDDVRIIQPTAPASSDVDIPSKPDKPAPSSEQPPVTSQPESSSSQVESSSSQVESSSSQAEVPPSSSSKPPPPESSSSSEIESPAGDATYSQNGMIVYDGKAMSLFGGNDNIAKWYANSINAYADTLPDVDFYNLIVPTTAEFNLPPKYQSLTGSQKRTIDLIYETLDSDVKGVDAYSQISAHTDEYLYFNTDHHWTGRGAYYAYRAFCETSGIEPYDMEDYTAYSLDNFIGTMYGYTQDTTLLDNPDFVEYFVFSDPYTAVSYRKGAPFVPYQHSLWADYATGGNSYSVFLHGDFPHIEVKTQNTNGKKLAIVKDSFGNAFAPFTVPHYEEVHIIDHRYFERDFVSFAKETGITDVVFVTNTFAACTPYHVQCIENLSTQEFAN